MICRSNRLLKIAAAAAWGGGGSVDLSL